MHFHFQPKNTSGFVSPAKKYIRNFSDDKFGWKEKKKKKVKKKSQKKVKKFKKVKNRFPVSESSGDAKNA
jgi:hypothetical protein